MRVRKVHPTRGKHVRDSFVYGLSKEIIITIAIIEIFIIIIGLFILLLLPGLVLKALALMILAVIGVGVLIPVQKRDKDTGMFVIDYQVLLIKRARPNFKKYWKNQYKIVKVKENIPNINRIFRDMEKYRKSKKAIFQDIKWK